jgi:hypothetical protein
MKTDFSRLSGARWCLTWVFLTVCITPSMAADPGNSSADASPAKRSTAAGAVACYASSEFSSAIVLVPQRVVKACESEPALQPLLAAAASRFGCRPANLDSLSALLTFADDGKLGMTGIVYRSSAAIEAENLLPRGAGADRVVKGVIDDKPCFSRDQGEKDRLTVCLPDEHTALVSLESGVRSMLHASARDSALAGLLGEITEVHDLVVAAVVPPLRPAIARLRSNSGSRSPQGVLRYLRLADLTRRLTLRVNFFDDQRTEAVFYSENEAAAVEVLGLLREAHQDLVKFLLDKTNQDDVDRLLGKVDISRKADEVALQCHAGGWIMHMLVMVVGMTDRGNGQNRGETR